MALLNRLFRFILQHKVHDLTPPLSISVESKELCFFQITFRFPFLFSLRTAEEQHTRAREKDFPTRHHRDRRTHFPNSMSEYWGQYAARSRQPNSSSSVAVAQRRDSLTKSCRSLPVAARPRRRMAGRGGLRNNSSSKHKAPEDPDEKKNPRVGVRSGAIMARGDIRQK